MTICTHNRKCVLGDVVGGEMQVKDVGKIVEDVWNELPNHYPHVGLDAFVIMPNHVHGIIVLNHPSVGAGLKPAPTLRHGLSEIVRAFKTFTARKFNQLRGTQGIPFWQRNYYEHLIRNERALSNIRQYIAENPNRWEEDEYYFATEPMG